MPAERLGERLRRLRKEADLTQDQLAHEVGVSLQSISMIERGVRESPAPSTVRGLARFFEVSEQYILYGREIEPAEDWGQLDPELVHFYRRLDGHAREALLQNARTLRELQGKYGSGDGANPTPPPDEPGPDDPSSFHPPGTMGHIFTPAADSGEDLKVAENRRRYDEEQRRKREAEPDDP